MGGSGLPYRSHPAPSLVDPGSVAARAGLAMSDTFLSLALPDEPVC